MSATCCNHEAETKLEHIPVETPQDTHYANGLRKLCDPSTVHEHFDEIMENVCQYEFDCYYPPVPDRHHFLKSLPIARAVKRDALKRNPGLKRRSTHGYIWVDHDPMAILANKYIVRSCHLLDNTEHEYRCGNFNHVYNPYMATLFAGRENPSVEIDAVSPESGDALYVGGKAQNIRKHQAVCNVFLLADEERKPYLFVSRLYDSCDEVGWAWAIARYCRVYAKRLGIGVCFDNTWSAKHATRSGECGAYETWPDNYSYHNFVSPKYPLPTAPRRFPGYHDGGLSTYSHDSGSLVSASSAYVVVRPTTDERLERGECNLTCCVARGVSNTVYCASCETGVNRNHANYVNGDYYCDDCCSEEFSHCEGCEELVREVRALNDYYYCESCYSDRVTNCARCCINVPNNDATEIDNDSFCASCVEECCQICERCDELLIEWTCRGYFGGAVTTYGNVTWHTPADGGHTVPMCECCDEDATKEEESAIQREQEAEEERRKVFGIVDARPASQAEVLPLYAGHLDPLVNCAIIAARCNVTQGGIYA